MNLCLKKSFTRKVRTSVVRMTNDMSMNMLLIKSLGLIYIEFLTKIKIIVWNRNYLRKKLGVTHKFVVKSEF